ncbi:MAG: GTPase ObgE, partial [Nitrospirae bacterium]
FPNAGKSTLISTVSAARPEIADYPFTTLRPHLGVVAWAEFESFIMADIPGLIEGAHKGKGLGTQFLRHIQRTALLLYLIEIAEGSMQDPVASFDILQRELASFDPHLAQRPFAVVGTKLDLQGGGGNLVKLQHFCKSRQIPFFAISSITHQGIPSLIQYVGAQLAATRTLCAANA